MTIQKSPKEQYVNFEQGEEEEREGRKCEVSGSGKEHVMQRGNKDDISDLQVN